VPPWDLARKPIFWRDAALEAEAAENWAETEMMKQARGPGNVAAQRAERAHREAVREVAR